MRNAGLVEGDLPKIHAAQASGCAPVVDALERGLDHPEPVKPNTIAKSIAIGNPADGFHVLETVRSTGGVGASVSDEEIIDSIQLLARTEGVFTEPAGGTTLAATIQLIKRGVIPKDESLVVCITGNGYKTADVMIQHIQKPSALGRTLQEFEDFIDNQNRNHSEGGG